MSVSDRTSRLRRLRLLTTSALAVMTLAATASLIAGILMAQATSKQYSERSTLLSRIEKAVNNGADLRSVKQIFSNRQRVRPKLWPLGYSNDRYGEPVNLSTVLEDLRANAFLRDDASETLVATLDQIIAEHEQTNPFDQLEPTQRLHFESLRSKLGESYPTIRPNVDRIVGELASRNQLVAEYLADATLSFRLSIIALVVGLVALIPQVAQGIAWWRTRRGGEPGAA